MGALELGFGIVLLVFAVGIIALVLLQEGQQQNENRVFISYLPGSEMSLEEAESVTDQPFISKDYFASFENFLCYMDLYLSK